MGPAVVWGMPGKPARIDNVMQFSDLQTLLRGVRDAPDLGGIGVVMSDATRQLGFDYFAMVQDGALTLSDLPAAWRDALESGTGAASNPVLAACGRSATPFAWSELAGLITMTPQHRAYVATAESFGLSRGYTVPVQVFGGASGHCSFVTVDDRALPEAPLSAVQYLACFAFEAVRRVAIARSEAAGVARLMSRQPDYIVRIGRGRANRAPGRAGVSGRTESVARLAPAGQPGVPGGTG